MLAREAVKRPVNDRADAFAAVLDRQLDSGYRLAAVILGDPVEAEDAVHDAAVAAWRAWHQLRDPARSEAWFTRILVNQCRDRLRARRRRHGVAPATPAIAADAAGPLAARDAIERALAVLDPDEQLVVVLRFWRDLTVDQIAERLGIPAGTVKSRLHHALGRLRTALRVDEGRS